MAARRRSKYRAVPVVIDGHRFPSKAEGEFYQKLVTLKSGGQVEWFALQPEFLLPGGIAYRADFIVKWSPLVRGILGEHGVTEIIDVKGFKTAEYRLKKKLAASIGINIVEVSK